jgi:hypothetical protein
MKKETDLQSVDTVEVLQTLGNPIRKFVVAALGSQYKALKFSELMAASGLDPNFNTGQFWYHISELMKRRIVLKEEEKYKLTQFGFKLAKVLSTVERECSFLFKEQKNGGERRVKENFQIRKYIDGDFEQVAILVKEMYDYYWKELWRNGEMSLEDAGKAVATDLLVPGTYVYVAEDLVTKKIVGFVNYAVTHGGAFFVDYLWVKKEHLDAGLREALLERVEEDVLEAGEDCYNVRIGLQDKLYGEFFINFGFNELNQLEITKHLKEAPKRKFSAQDVDVFGYKFRSVILWAPESKKSC